MFFQQLKERYLDTSERSKDAVNNIVLSLVGKVVSVLSSLMIVPLTIDYINPTQYGIWLTLSSIIGWINFFDLGLGNGFRNKFAEARSKGNNELASEYLSTTYFAVTSVITIVFLVILVGNRFVDWSSVLNVDIVYHEELKNVFLILSFFFCLNMVVNLISVMLTADQKVGLSSLIMGVGQLVSLLAIFVLTKFSEGSLTNLALYFAGVPCLVSVIATIFIYASENYKQMRPCIKKVRLSLVKDIMGLGVQFFIIYLCLIAIFQIINVVISREFGPVVVTEYNIAYKYFNVLNSIIIIIITPFWSAFTDAYQKEDFGWMKTTIRQLERMWIVSAFICIVMCVLSQPFYLIWIGPEVNVGILLSWSVAIYFIANNIGMIYMYLINGIGTIRIQLIVYVLFALISWPLMIFLGNCLGVIGILAVPTTVMLVQALLGKIQLSKLMSHSASGIWTK